MTLFDFIFVVKREKMFVCMWLVPVKWIDYIRMPYELTRFMRTKLLMNLCVFVHVLLIRHGDMVCVHCAPVALD